MAEKQIVEASEKPAAEERVSDGPTDMDIDSAQKSLEESGNDAEGEKIIQEEEALDMKAWMANQEQVTAELQKKTATLQKTNDEIKD